MLCDRKWGHVEINLVAYFEGLRLCFGYGNISGKGVGILLDKEVH